MKKLILIFIPIILSIIIISAKPTKAEEICCEEFDRELSTTRYIRMERENCVSSGSILRQVVNDDCCKGNIAKCYSSDDSSSNPFIEIYKFFRDPILQSLRCGAEATSAIGRLISCAFEFLEVLKNFALILLAIAFIGAAIYLISTPFFGLKQIAIAWRILIWAPVGMVIVFLGDIIKDQIERIFLR